jgi:hypothetical protein
MGAVLAVRAVGAEYGAKGSLMTQVRALLLLSAVIFSLAPSLGSAQTIQGQIIITEVPPSGPTVPPGYVQAPQPQVVVAPVAPQVVQMQQPQMSCPPGSTMSPDRYGRPVCMEEVTRHRGIGMLAGGYVASVFTTLFTGIIGAFSTGSSGYTVSDLDNYVTFGFIPLIGPFVQLGFVPPFADEGLYAWLVVEGLLQAGGLTMLIFGAIGEEYTDFRPIAGVDVHLRPMLSASTQGLSATVTF